MSGRSLPLFIKPSFTESPVKELEKILGCNWKNIEGARQNTQTTLLRLSEVIAGLPGPDTSVVVLGSLGRLECTHGSDLDWTLLVDGQADASDHRNFLEIKNALSSTNFEDLGLKEPGPEGVFGNLTFSQPIMHFIGGEEDSNSNTTRRVLLLLEGLPIGERCGAFDRVRNGILRRYLDEDRGLL
jgi:predicted nucleotidyltransferase